MAFLSNSIRIIHLHNFSYTLEKWWLQSGAPLQPGWKRSEGILLSTPNRLPVFSTDGKGQSLPQSFPQWCGLSQEHCRLFIRSLAQSPVEQSRIHQSLFRQVPDPLWFLLRSVPSGSICLFGLGRYCVFSWLSLYFLMGVNCPIVWGLVTFSFMGGFALPAALSWLIIGLDCLFILSLTYSILQSWLNGYSLNFSVSWSFLHW